MQADQSQLQTSEPIRLDVRTASLADVKAALRAGLRDLGKRPALSIFFGLIYALFGATLILGLANFEQIWILVSVAVGFPLVAPFLAAGLYEMSRRHSRNEPYTASDIFLVIFNQQRRQFGWMSFLVLFIFWIWAYQVRLVLALTLHYSSFRSIDHFFDSLFTTGEGATFLLLGSLVGAVLATILFTLTVIAMPLLLDKNVDVVTAMITSVKTVLQSPMVMLGWGAAIGALTLLAIAPLFLGVIILFPILGHTSWHLYARLISEEQ
ncbi:DUF2189 domain-containing protein [Minwuia sp.]|uniref:DUF2189 domain-containing protein n=1 Tax=Minwuia sp. TaxID=2493630 RepID=UPI003A93037E